MTGATPPARRTRNHSATPAQRLRILERDDWRCRGCGVGLTNTDPRLPTHGHAGHVVGHIDGGKPTDDNLMAQCRLCNQQAGGDAGKASRRNRAQAYEKELQSTRAELERVRDELRAMNASAANNNGTPPHPQGVRGNAQRNKKNGARANGNGGFFEAGGARGSSVPASLVPMDPKARVAQGFSPVWARCEWTAELVNSIPDNALWPRYMSFPHPDAIGSYGAELVTMAQERRGKALRWWQQLAAARILEHDKNGALCWREWMLTLSRQGGKSWLMSELAMWRVERASLFADGPQLVMHVADKLQTGDEVQAYARAWAKARKEEGWKSSESAGAKRVEAPDGSRWRVFSKDTPYGWSAGLALIDEVWALRAAIVEDGIEPTQIERTWPQLGLLSSAHPRATSLFIDRRATALAGGSILLLEWSTPRYLELDDRQGWRMASPHWTPQREQTVERALQRALSARSSALNEEDPIATFRGQYLNQWPERADNEQTLPGDALFTPGAWAQLAGPADPVGPVVFAVEDFAGIAVAVAAAGRDASGTITLEAYVLPGDRRVAYDWIAVHSASRSGSSLVVGSALADDAPVVELGATLTVVPMSYSDTRAALSLLRQVVNRRGLVHADTPELDGQVKACRVAEGTAGLRVASSSRWDVIRAAAWAVGAVERERRNAPSVY